MGIPFLLLGEWFRILPNVFSDYPMSPVHIQHHLSFVCIWGKLWCVPPVVMYIVMVDDIIYESLLQVGNLRISSPEG